MTLNSYIENGGVTQVLSIPNLGAWVEGGRFVLEDATTGQRFSVTPREARETVKVDVPEVSPEIAFLRET